MDQLIKRVEALDLDGKVLLIQGGDYEISDLSQLRALVTAAGGIGVMFLQDGDIEAKSIEQAIDHLQRLKIAMSN